MHDLKQIMKELIEDFGFRMEDVASKTGITVMSAYRIKNGTVKTPHRTTADSIVRLWRYEKKKREIKAEKIER